MCPHPSEGFQKRLSQRDLASPEVAGFFPEHPQSFLKARGPCWTALPHFQGEHQGKATTNYKRHQNKVGINGVDISWKYIFFFLKTVTCITYLLISELQELEIPL